MAAVIALLLPAMAESRIHQPIYFFTNTTQPINKQNPLVLRPKGFLLFQDGQWVLERLRWTGWGSSVAHATGVSSSSDDIPNAAEGKRIKTWAHVTLSNPGRFHGHEVYRCFTMTVPPPASDMHLCLGHAHGIYMLEPPKQPSPTPMVSNPPEFRARLAGGTIGCAVGVEGTFCQGVPTVPEGSDPLVEVARLQPNGLVTNCTEYRGAERSTCYEGNMGDPIPDLSPGQASTVGPFTCKVLEAGVECTVTATGRGFLITPESVTEVGG